MGDVAASNTQHGKIVKRQAARIVSMLYPHRIHIRVCQRAGLNSRGADLAVPCRLDVFSLQVGFVA